MSRRTVPPYLTLVCGLRRIAATVAWCDQSLELIAALDDGHLTAGKEQETRRTR